MAHPLDEAHAKVARAREHLKELHRQSVVFVDAHPYNVVPQIDDKTGQLVGILRADKPEEPVPVELGILAGDFAHNMRSALNYLAWQLALPPVGEGPGDLVQFPVYFDVEGREYRYPAKRRFSDGENRLLRGIRQPHRALIERAQPYHGGHREYLALLALLNDGDKHRVVTTAGILGHIDPPDLSGFSGQMHVRMNPSPAVYDGAEVFRLLGIAPAGEQQVRMKFAPTYEIGFGDNPMIVTTNGMWRATRYVKLILRVFRDVF